MTPVRQMLDTGCSILDKKPLFMILSRNQYPASTSNAKNIS
jgi:hypothetical protein